LYFGDGKTNTRCVIPKGATGFFWNGIVFDTAHLQAESAA
jgi:hypothetical protein